MNKVEVVTSYDVNKVVTIQDMEKLADLSKLTLNKIIRGAGLQPVAQLRRESAGRPPKLFDRATLEAAISVHRANVAASRVAQTNSETEVGATDKVAVSA